MGSTWTCNNLVGQRLDSASGADCIQKRFVNGGSLRFHGIALCLPSIYSAFQSHDVAKALFAVFDCQTGRGTLIWSPAVENDLGFLGQRCQACLQLAL
jgi:hypothetical protein